MPEYPFIVQSSASLDEESQKYVRAHASRHSNNRRRELSLHFDRKPVPITPRRGSRSRQHGERRDSQQEQEQEPEDEEKQLIVKTSDSSKRQIRRKGVKTANCKRTYEIKQINSSPSGQLTGTTAEFCSFDDIPRGMLIKLLGSYRDLASLYIVNESYCGMETAPFSGYLNTVAHQNSLWLAASALVSFAKCNTIRDQSPVEVLQYKALTLQLTQKALKTAKTEVNELTILSIAFLLIFEMYCVETAEDHATVINHYNGLMTLIQLYGGIQRVVQTPLGPFLVSGATTYFLLYGIMENTLPLGNIDDPPKLWMQDLSLDEQSPFCFSPILTTPSAFNQEYVPRYAPSIIPFLSTLNHAWELLFLEYHSTTTSSVAFAASRTQVRLPPEPPIKVTGNVKEDILSTKVSRACYLAGFIFHRAVTSLVDFKDRLNKPLATELYSLMKVTDHCVWDSIPYIYLWIGMVGVASSVNAQQKHFFCLHVSRSNVVLTERWREFARQTMLNFLWFQKVLRCEVEPKVL